MNKIKNLGQEEKFLPPFNVNEAVRDLKVSVVTLEHYVEICPDLHLIKEFENRLRKLMKKVEARRSLLQEEKGIEFCAK